MIDPQLSHAGASIWNLANWLCRSAGLPAGSTAILRPARSRSAAFLSADLSTKTAGFTAAAVACPLVPDGCLPRLLVDSPLMRAFPCPSASPRAVVAAGLRSVSVSSPEEASSLPAAAYPPPGRLASR